MKLKIQQALQQLIRVIVDKSETFLIFEEYFVKLLICELFPPCIHRVSKVKL